MSLVTKKNVSTSQRGSPQNLQLSNSQTYAASLLQQKEVDTSGTLSGDKRSVTDLFAYYAAQVFEAVRKSIHLSLQEYLKCVNLR